jgi:type 2 lantibiotic biosynthesis protein LanM
VDVLDYADALASGFTNLYRLLCQHREALLAAHGPLANFAADTVRVIVRATRTYAMLLTESFHPDVLRHALDRDRLFDRLWVGVETFPYLARLIPAEREDLLKGDIPLFTTHPASRDLWTSSDQRMANVLDEPSLVSVQRRVQQLSAEDLERQLWILRASLTSLTLRPEVYKARPASQLTASPTVADRESLLAAACAVGDRLATLALRGAHDVSWIGLTLRNDRHWSIAPLGYDLYDGLPGVTLFLAYLGAMTQEERYTSLARSAFATLQRHVEQQHAWIGHIGAFSGWGGLLYTLTHLGILWQQPDLMTQAEQWLALLPPLIAKDAHYDIIGGAAGCLSSVLSLYRQHPSASALEVARQCGERLLSQAQAMEHGCGWAIRGVGTRPLAGFSHGSAGIAWALLELAALTGEERFRTTALAAIAYERSLFSHVARNWPDLRELETAGGAEGKAGGSFMTAWCHGAPGIGLARLQCLQYLDDAEIRAEIDVALRTTLAQGFGHNHSLCHGDLGNLELLLQAGEVLAEPQWRAQGEQQVAGILTSMAQHGWRCGIPFGVESPGLMTGLAGIGFGLLRCAEPRRVPAVLVLAPPAPYSDTASIPQGHQAAQRVAG